MRGFLLAVVVVLGCTMQQPAESTEVVVEGLDTPWGIDFLPDGRMIFTERGGTVSLYDGSVREIAQIDVSELSESGLLGVAVDPDFSANNFVYLYYTHGSGLVNRVSRFRLENILSDETVLLDGIPSARFHDGGRIKFGPDGMLYITTGDATTPSSAQDTSSLAGKILRINKDGSIPPDNPFGNSVYSYGHRNPQGLSWGEGLMYASEHGQDRNDEINIIQKGGNYGWPQECTDEGNFSQPIRCYTEFTMAPSGIAFLDGSLYVAGLRGNELRKLTIQNGIVTGEETLIDDIGRVREAVVHDDFLYITTNNRDGRGIPKQGDDKIMRIRLGK